MVNPTHLTTLVAVLRTGSFAAAARQLGYTGSAVSQQIASFEREVGLKLFERDARGIRPTAAALQLEAHAGGVFAALSKFDDYVREVGAGTAGHVRIGSFPTANRQLVPSAIAAFVRQHAEVELEMDEDEPNLLIPRLVARELDVAIVYEYDLVPVRTPASLRRIRLLSEDLVALLPPGHPATGTALSIRDLRDETWVMTRPGSGCALALERVCAAAGFVPQARYRSNNYSVVASFVRSGLGVALIPAMAAAPLLDGELGTAKLLDAGIQRHVSALVSAEGNPALEQLVDFIQAAAHQLASQSAGVHVVGAMSQQPPGVTPLIAAAS